MPRSRGSSGRSSGSSTKTRTSSGSSSSSSSARAPTQSNASSKPAPAPQPAPAAQVPSQGPGMLASIAANATSIAAGHVMAHTIIGAIEGRGDKESRHENVNTQTQSAVCTSQMKAFNDCMKDSENDISMCQWAYDALKRCQGTN
eukprot:TRINITY_DN5078_c0_g1_i1.p1 TRINITY_DN5078_c0_g1~~TRINITY_DN5078_c0_g1_i1.p1  ORF type:complete len:159 (+),score=49.19 TRINITY_DN5078_c0_g1_i1:44-478(+)